MTPDHNLNTLNTLTASIVSSYISRNPVATSSLPGLIQSVYDTMSTLGAAPVVEERREPAVPIKKSVFPDHIVCLEDGKKLKMLKRHLKTAYNMSPEQYRQKWGLPLDYPMIAPNYSAQRSELALQIGLGRKAEAAPEVALPVEAPVKVDGRRKKAG